jgi:hypothetical protein
MNHPNDPTGLNFVKLFLLEHYLLDFYIFNQFTHFFCDHGFGTIL